MKLMFCIAIVNTVFVCFLNSQTLRYKFIFRGGDIVFYTNQYHKPFTLMKNTGSGPFDTIRFDKKSVLGAFNLGYRNETAKYWFKRVIKERNSNTYNDAVIGLSLAFANQNKINKAKSILDKATIVDSSFLFSKYILKGLYEYILNDYDLSINNYEKARQFNIDGQDISNFLQASAYYQLRKHDSAITNLNKINSDWKNVDDKYLNLASNYIEKCQSDSALLCLQKIKELVELKDSSDYFGIRAIANYNLSHFGEAIEDFKMELSLDPLSEIETLRFLSRAYVQLKDYDEAIFHYKKLDSYHALEYPFDYLQFTNSYKLKNEIGNAEKMLKRGLKRWPDDEKLLNLQKELNY